MPNSFSEARPPFIFTSQETNAPLPDRPSRSQPLQPEILERIHHFRTPNTPRLTTDLLKAKDTPLLHVHIHNYTDVTCIGFHIPHSVVDVPGLGIILRAWCSLISAKNNMQDVTLPRLFESDPLTDFGLPYPTSKKDVVAFRQTTRTKIPIFSLWENFRYYVPMIYDLALNESESRTLFIPFSVIENIRKKIMVHGEGESEKKVVWVSENDVVTAILAKACIQYFSRASSHLAPHSDSLFQSTRKQETHHTSIHGESS